MQCREFEERMHDFLDRRRLPERDELLSRHAQACDACGQLLAGQADLFSGLSSLPMPSLSSGFAKDVMARAMSAQFANKPAAPTGSVREIRRNRGMWLAFAGGIASLAAIALVAIAIGVTLRRSPAEPTVAKKGSLPPAKATELVRATTPQSDVPAPTHAKAVAPPKIEPDYTEYREAIHSLTAQFPSAVEKIDEVQQSTPAIRPLRASFSLAIGTLQKTIPNRPAKREPQPAKPDRSFFGILPEAVV